MFLFKYFASAYTKKDNKCKKQKKTTVGFDPVRDFRFIQQYFDAQIN
jgi:hypothetical protein